MDCVLELQLGQRVVPGLLTVGKYDGTHPCLTWWVASQIPASSLSDLVVICRGTDPL